ncbi:MAG: hypothetical protein IPK50_00620 [Fibrobacterota bacterium]|nr:hypothetical protein [Fibrobacterota bacterium]QQS05419.1 MAG: hypothetical protein IPK50_00620 [Fibrobacterota bacterium]
MQKAKQFLTKNLATRLLPLLLVGWFAQSCNNSVVVEDDPPPPPPTRTVDSLPIYSLGGEAFLPDSASWKIGKDSGKATFVKVKTVSKDTAIVAAKLDHKTFTDTLKVQYWKLGILIQTRLYLSNGNDIPRAVNPGGKIFQGTNSILMAAFYEAHGKDSAQYPLTRAGFLASYANMVLTGNAKANFPDSLPAGISKDTIRIIVIQLAVKRNILATDLVNTQLGLDRAQLMDLVDKLIGAKILDPGVKDKLFPPSSIKWDETFGVEAASVKQGEILGLKGKVSSGSKWTSQSIEILNKDNLSVTSQFATTSPKDSTTLIFTGVAKLIPSADLGMYTVRFSGKNEKNETTSQQATFEVVKSDDPAAVLAPQITRIQPSGKDSTLDFGTENVVLKWKVKDDSRHAIVVSLINGMEAKLVKDGADSVYTTEIKLAPGQDSTVRFKATSNSTKSSLDSVVLHRAKDNIKPRITKGNWGYLDTGVINSAGAYEFGKEEVTVVLNWTVSDNYKLHPDSAACILAAGRVVRCLEVKITDPKKPLEGEVSFSYAVPNLYSNVTLRVKDAAGLTEDYKVDFVRPQKEGDILAEWDRFNWDAPKVVWQ